MPPPVLILSRLADVVPCSAGMLRGVERTRTLQLRTGDFFNMPSGSMTVCDESSNTVFSDNIEKAVMISPVELQQTNPQALCLHDPSTHSCDDLPGTRGLRDPILGEFFYLRKPCFHGHEPSYRSINQVAMSWREYSDVVDSPS